jgi:phosphonate dehydrogenase
VTDRPKIVVTNPVHAEVASRLTALGETVLAPGPEPLSPPALASALADADAMLGFMTDRVDGAVLSGASRLKVIACALKGYDGYDLAACTRSGVWLTIVPDLLTAPTAELAVGLAVGLGRRVREGDALVRAGAFVGWRAQFYGAGLDGATVAIIGLGLVGRAIAARLAGFGCALIGVDPRADVVPDVPRVSFEDALARADVVIFAVPLTAESIHVLGRDALARMKANARIVNVGRGSVVDEEAVADALFAGRLGGYAADVFAFEDWSLPGRPRAVPARLLAAPNTLFTPHLGSAVASVRRAIEHRAVDNIEAVLAGRVPPDAVNAPVNRSAA